MRVLSHLRTCLVAAALVAAKPATDQSTSQSILDSSFKPPQVFKNTNLVRNINIDKAYVRETVNVVVDNVDKAPQDAYYVPFPADVIGKVGAFEVKDRNNDAVPPFKTEVVEYDTYGATQYYRVTFPQPLAPSKQITLSITYSILDSLTPRPSHIGQADKQYLSYAFNAFASAAYPTSKQRTKLKLLTNDIPDITTIPKTAGSQNEADPVRQGNTLTYGDFGLVPAGAYEPVSVRFDSTRPVNHVSTLERDIEVSHWGGNLAIEERYVLVNKGAALKENFDRIAWAATQYYSQSTAALKELIIPLKAGSANAYFIDDVGNVSTSHFRSSNKEAKLELRPRYPLFGQWNYKFKIGWDQDLSSALRKLKEGDKYVLRVPFLEGPKNKEGFEYEKVRVRVVLPEGASNVEYETRVPLVATNQSLHRTFMDTQGRTSLTLTAVNLVDDLSDRDLIVTYDYPFVAGFRKPVTIVTGVFAVFAFTYALSRVDVGIGRKV